MGNRAAAILKRAVWSVVSTDRTTSTDRELLGRFARESDEAAFEALVGRHAALVFGVCRRALPTVQDAEDACQATFLLLARKAGSVRWQPSAANWLHATARKVARNARVAAERRARREAAAAVPEAVEPVDRMSARELLVVLDEELDRLTPCYREVIVLCHLEGLTLNEASARLGVPVGTLKSRVARGRKLLGEALAGRGCALGVGLLALAVSSTAGASPPRLVKSILASASGSPPAAVDTLAKGVAVSGIFKKTLIAPAAVVVVALGFVLGAGASGTPGKQPPGAGGGLPGQPGAGGAKAPAPEESVENVTYRGRVFGSDGKPAAGAKLHVTPSWGNGKRLATSPEFATTGPDGRFEFSAPRLRIDDRVPDTVVVASAAGHGVGWAEVRGGDKGGGKSDDLTLRLVADDVPVAGRIIDLEGRPVRGASVRVLKILAAPRDDLGPWLEAVKAKKEEGRQPERHLTRQLPAAELPGLSATVTTDAEGRFKLTGIGRDRLVVLRLDGPTVATEQLRVLTRTGEAVPEFGEPGTEATYYGATFKHAAGPSTPIVGVVRDRDTKKPLAGLTIKSHKFANSPFHGVDFITTTTDEQGRYRLTGMPKGKDNKILLAPRADQPYLTVHAAVPDTSGFDPVTVDFDVRRGVWIEGKVTDKATGKPVRGTVQYLVAGDNPNLDDYPGYLGTHSTGMTNNVRTDGTYRIVGIPGPGLVALQYWPQYLIAPERDDDEGADRPSLLFTVPGAHASIFNSLARVDPAQGAEKVTRNLTLDPGLTFTGTVVGPDGKPLPGARAFGLTAWDVWDGPALGTAEFTVRAFNPRRPRPVLFRHIEKGLVGMFAPPKDAGKPVTLQLQPGAAVAGRLVDANGRSHAGVALDLSIMPPGDSGATYTLPNKTRTDKDGRFRVEALPAGSLFQLRDREDLLEFGKDLRPGETKDLGDVRTKPPGE